MGLLNKKRFVNTFYLFFVILLLISVHLAVIQLVQGDNYAAKALEQQTIAVQLEDFPRGQILDRHLHSLTGSFQANRVVVFPLAISEPDSTASQLARILKVSKEEVFSGLTGTPGYLPYPLSSTQAQTIRQQNWPGIQVLPVSFRYGDQPLAAQVVGHLGQIDSRKELTVLSSRSKKDYRLNEWVGKAGLEKFYEHELKVPAAQRYARLFIDAHGTWLQGMGIQVDNHNHKRKNLITTIDIDIQKTVERIMDRWVKKGAVVVMDVPTGDILAMASRPAYNPEPGKLGRYLHRAAEESFLDQCTTLYPPGSLFKVVVSSAALAEKIVTPKTTFTCQGAEDRPVRCWHNQGHGTITFAEALAQSCNPVFARLALELGADKLIVYARKFGLDNQKITGYPVARDPRQNLELIGAPYHLVNSSLGQGPVLVTPVQITAMINTIANDGVYLQPRLVREIRSDDGQVVRSFPASRGRKVISKDVAHQIRQLLELVTTRGTGQEAYLPGYGSAGKTGSAQVSNLNGNICAWFSGYAPVDHPKYVVTVLIREGISGSQTAAPVFREIISSLLN